MSLSNHEGRRNTFSRLLLLMAVSASTTFATAQSRVTGKIVDETGEPIIGATVKVQGSSVGTVTDIDGNFALPSVPKEGTLTVTYVGYKSQTVKPDGRSQIELILKEDHEQLDEIVVVGYGVQRKSDVTGALAHIDSKQLTEMPVKNALEGMQGKTAGVDITNSQRPGTVGSISVRGQRSINASSAPLYVVDGMIIQNGGIDNINPQDIESIEVLKDASSTAVYGARGANGVILVTTKKGKEGKVSISYAGSVTFSNIHEVTEFMSPSEWVDYARYALYNQGGYGDKTKDFAPDYDSDLKLFGGTAGWANIEQAWNNGTYNPALVGGYDWVGHGKQTGITQDHTLSVSGGTDKIKAYGSFGYLNQTGTQKGQRYSRFTVNSNVEVRALNYFTMGVGMNASYGDQNYGYSYMKSVTGAGDYYGALRGMIPYTVPYDQDGNFIEYPWSYNTNIQNPIEEINYTTNKRRTFRISGNVWGQLDFGKMWKPLEGLQYRLQFGPELRFYRLGMFFAAEGINGQGNNVATYNPTQNVAWTLDNLIYYNRTFAENHHVGVTLLQTASKAHFESGNIKANVATAEELWYNTASLGSPLGYGTGLSEDQLTSYMIRGNYNYKDKYLATASVRWDGSSRLAPGHKWASFPSFSLGWRIDQEKFMQQANWVSNLKMRVGWGVSGNYAIEVYGTKGAIQGAYYNWGKNPSEIGYVPSDASAKNPSRMANQNLGWEKTYQWNFGLDYGFVNGRINGSLDVYTNSTKGVLMSMSIPSLTGYTSTYANVGATSGWGVDFQLNAIPVKTRDFTWSSTLTWTLDRNKIKRLANNITEDTNNNWFVGEEIGVIYDYVYDGIWKTDEADEAAKYGRKPGQIKVKDLDPDGKIGDTDKTIIGKTRPRWTGGWHNSFTYKNIELSFFIYTRWKFDVAKGYEVLGGMYNMRKLDYFIAGKNETAEYYMPGSNGSAADLYASTMNLQDGSFIKMRNISLGYTFTPKELKSLGLNSLKVYVQAHNPFNLYKKCKWLDTDFVSYDNSTTSFGSATTIKSWVIGLNIGI